MPFVKVLKNGLITLPKKFRDSLDIHEGEILEVELKKSGLVLKPKALVDKAELSAQGKMKLGKAIKAYEKGDYKEFSDVDEAIKDLNS